MFDDDLKAGKSHRWDFLGGWLFGRRNAPEIGARVYRDTLERVDLFWFNAYCRHMVCFDQRPFKFETSSAFPLPNNRSLRVRSKDTYISLRSGWDLHSRHHFQFLLSAKGLLQ